LFEVAEHIRVCARYARGVAPPCLSAIQRLKTAHGAILVVLPARGVVCWNKGLAIIAVTAPDHKAQAADDGPNGLWSDLV